MAATTSDIRSREHDTPFTDSQWQARVDLAAAHRLAVKHQFNEGIFNHFTLSVPGCDDRYLQIPFGMHWSEVTASSFMEVGYDGRLLSGEGEIEQSCYCIHAPIHRLNPDAACVMHTHMPFASALAKLEDPRILPIGQTEVGVLMQTAYDMEYTGPAFCPTEGERLAEALGDKSILIMANHGVLTVGRTVAEAYDRLYYVERAAQGQLYAMWSGRPLHVLSDEVIAHTIEQFHGAPRYGNRSNAEHHFDALKRVLDREDSGYTN
ncbi:MAG: class II aldolase/adducin family protein [Gammaproteobacteria bacterium]|nr:class II aldolase/adducin family protein [Gammaproteobacteria bacterium]